MWSKFLNSPMGGGITFALLVLAFSSNNLSKLIDSFAPSKVEITRPGRGPDSVEEYATKAYVDSRINDLDAKSQLRHDTVLKAQEASNNMMAARLDTLTKVVQTLSDRVFQLATARKQANALMEKELACKSPVYAVFRKPMFTTASYSGKSL